MLHKDGVDLPEDEQVPVADPKNMRSLYEHFHEISDMERQHLDLREYRIPFDQRKSLNVEVGTERKASEGRRSSGLSGAVQNMRVQKQMRSKFDRALPRVYVETNEALLKNSKVHQ